MAVIVGIDRLNQGKGIIHKLTAYEQFLKDHPEWIGKSNLSPSNPSRTRHF